MARIIKTTHPGINSFVFLTPEEAAEKYGGGFGFVGSPIIPPTPPPTPAPKPKRQTRKRKGGK